MVVSPEDDAEVRRVSITNSGVRTREIQVTSYAEICLASPGRRCGPSGVFQLVRSDRICSRCRRAACDAPQAIRQRKLPFGLRTWSLWKVKRSANCNSRRTARAFIGRGHDVRNPVSIVDGRPLSNTVGSVLDPVISLRRTVRIPPGTTARVVFSTIVAPTREQVMELADKYRGRHNL